jgi:hypothetical protein
MMLEALAGITQQQGASAFLPSDLPGITAWWDASDATTITSSSGSVTGWDDKSGSNHLIQAGAVGVQPTTGATTQNGLNVIDFTVAEWLYVTSGTRLDAPYTLFFTSAVSSSGRTVNGGSLQYICFNAGGYAVNMSAGSSGTGGTPVNSDFRVWGGNVNSPGSGDGYDDIVYLDGNEFTVKSDGGYFELAHVGARVGGAFGMAGSIGEIIAVDGKLSDEYVASTQTYLADKWGITIA